MVDLRLSKSAERDLADIRLHSEREYGAQAANAYLRGFSHAFNRLRDHPRIGSLRIGLPERIRGLSHRRHIIFYQVTDSGIFVARILHQRQDAPLDWPNQR